MLNISFNLAEITQDEVKALQAMLSAYDQEAIKSQIVAGGFRGLGAEQRQEDPVPVDTTGDAPKAKRGRPRKQMMTEAEETADIMAAAKDLAHAVKENLEPGEAVTLAQPAVETSTVVLAPTKDELREALAGLLERKGEAASRALLEKYKCSRISDVVELPTESKLNFLAEAKR